MSLTGNTFPAVRKYTPVSASNRAQSAERQAAAPSRLAPPGVITAHIRRLQVQQERLLATLESIEGQLRAERAGHPDLRYWLLTLKAGVERGKALLDWSDDALADLKGTP